MISNYDDNSFKLTGVIESRDFNKGLKEIYLKLMIYFFDIWYHENADNFLRTIQLLHQEISADIDIPDLMNIFPSSWYDYLKKTHKNKNENFDVKIDIENIKQSPSNKEFEKEEDHVTTPKPKINVEENDMMILLGDLEEIDLMKTDIGMGKLNKPIESKRNEEKQKDLTSSHKTINDKIKEVLIFLFATSINQRNKDLDTKMNEETLFKLFNNGGLLNTRSWPKTIDENSLAKAISSCKNGIRLALKIALEIYAVEGHLLDIKDEDLKKNIKETEDKWFIGNRNSEELFEAINTKKENLMCLLYDFGKKETNVLRATSSKMQAYVINKIRYILKFMHRY